MDLLLGLPDDELDGLAMSLEQAPAIEPPAARRKATATATTNQSTTCRAHLTNLQTNLVGVESLGGVSVRDTQGRGLGLFTTRSFSCGETLFTERPQLAVASVGVRERCDWCMRSLVACPADLPHSHLWPSAPRRTACAGCGTLYCCDTCRSIAASHGHARLCDAIRSGDLVSFEECCRTQGAGLSADPRISIAAALLALRMMAHLAACGQGGNTAAVDAAEGASARAVGTVDVCCQCEGNGTTSTAGADGGCADGGATAPNATIATVSAVADEPPASACTSPYAHLSEETGTSVNALAARLHPLIRAVLRLSEAESRALDETVLRALLRSVSSNATWVQPVSAFADYVAASRSVRRRDEANETLARLQEHCALLRTQRAAELSGGERVDEVADEVYGARGGAVFLLQSKVNHSCKPNAKIVCSFTDATIDLVAAADLPAGAEVTISYIAPNLDRARRRQLLRAGYGFACTCELCGPEAVDAYPVSVE